MHNMRAQLRHGHLPQMVITFRVSFITVCHKFQNDGTLRKYEVKNKRQIQD